MTKKLVSVVVPCYNEAENVIPMHDALTEQFVNNLPEYDYDIIFCDNYSTDGTRDKLRLLCATDSKTKAIFNSRNFGQFNSPYHGMCQADGDCVICICCDFQDPVDLIPKFVHEWEKGHNVVAAIKTNSEENPIIRSLRTLYYKLIRKMSDVEQIEHFTGTGLYDRSFIDVMKSLDDPQPFLRGIVAELGPANRKDIPYTQAKRRAGKTHNNFATLYDAAMLSFTSYTKAPLRIVTIAGAVLSAVFILIAIGMIIAWLLGAIHYVAGITPVILLLLIIGALLLFSIGLVGEYVLTVNTRTMKRPLVIEEERLGDWGHAEKQSSSDRDS
jgi:glycosyltransferase involved in cell wall biosynthesis